MLIVDEMNYDWINDDNVIMNLLMNYNKMKWNDERT